MLVDFDPQEQLAYVVPLYRGPGLIAQQIAVMPKAIVRDNTESIISKSLANN